MSIRKVNILLVFFHVFLAINGQPALQNMKISGHTTAIALPFASRSFDWPFKDSKLVIDTPVKYQVIATNDSMLVCFAFDKSKQLQSFGAVVVTSSKTDTLCQQRPVPPFDFECLIVTTFITEKKGKWIYFKESNILNVNDH